MQLIYFPPFRAGTMISSGRFSFYSESREFAYLSRNVGALEMRGVAGGLRAAGKGAEGGRVTGWDGKGRGVK